MLRLALALPLLAAACAAPDASDAVADLDGPAGPSTATTGGDQKADATELRVRAGQMTMWVDRIAVAGRDGGEPVVVIEGRTSRNLTQVSSWVPDDAFGSAHQRSARTFDVELRGGHEINTLLSGLPIFVSFDTTTGAPTHYEGMIRLAPRLVVAGGGADVALAPAVDPVWQGTADDPLRYRGQATTQAAVDQIEVSAPEGAAPVVTRAGELGWDLAWTYAALERVLIDGGSIEVSAGGAPAVASVTANVVEIGLTVGDPREAWPSPTCTADVRACVRAGDGVDLADCGLYRQVSACVHEDPCGDPAPLELLPIDGSSTDAAADAYRADCGSGGAWCSLSALRGFSLPACPAEPVTVEAIFEQVRQLDQDHSTLEFSFGRVIDRAGAAATPFFSSSYSDGGPGLLDAVDALAQDPDGTGPIEAWSVSQQVPCHNCTDFQDTLILHYPGSATVIVLDGGHGFDS